MDQTSSSQCQAEARAALIVVVEDNPADVFMIKEAVAACGLDADLKVLQDGEEAMRLLDLVDEEGAPCPDVVLLDINLPRMDGFKVLERIRQGGKCANTPVIVMTSSPAEAERTRAVELGANAYFQKPSGYDDFLKIGEVIEGLVGSK